MKRVVETANLRWLSILVVCIAIAVPTGAQVSNPIVFVTQVPQPSDFATITSTFANQGGSVYVAPRGGDLWIRYVDGTLKNITAAAGYGVSGFQNDSAIAVRDPAVHWDGAKILFSMIIGSSPQYQRPEYRWQLYEATNLGQNQTPVIIKVPNQPSAFNNIMPAYGSDDKIIFVTDRPKNGENHLYPQLDEYESTPINTGIWKLNPANGDLEVLDHAPSGSFHPFVDSFGRIVFTRWDHLQQDQQAATDQFGAFNYAGEDAAAPALSSRAEIFPEPHDESRRTNPFLNLFKINHFFPWQMNEDGSDMVTLNHIGRHELHDFFGRNFNDDSNLEDYVSNFSNRNNPNVMFMMFQIKEDPRNPGLFYGIDAPEFRTHSAGQVVSITGAPNMNADDMLVGYVTHRDTSVDDTTPSANHSGLYRNPLPLSSGSILAVHTSQTGADSNIGTRAAPRSAYDFRIKSLVPQGELSVAGANLTSGISETVSWYDPDVLVTYSGNLWELQPVELVARTRPSQRVSALDPIESQIFAEEGVNLNDFRDYLIREKLALVVSRNVTARDRNDKQQPYNLKVAGSNTQTLGAGGKIYEVAAIQFVQGDQVRAYSQPSSGRRIIPQAMHDAPVIADQGNTVGSVEIASDGSFTSLVPAQRAMSWQLLDPQDQAVLRERYWVGFAPGEVRVCASCHGINTADQAAGSVPTNPPLALRNFLQAWKLTNGSGTPTPTPIATGSVTAAPSASPTTSRTATPSPTRTATRTATATRTRTPSRTATPSRTPSPSRTSSPAPSVVPTLAPTPSATGTAIPPVITPAYPRYSLAVSGRSPSGKMILGKLYSGRRGQIAITGLGNESANKSINLQLSINGQLCSQPLKNLLTSSTGNVRIGGTAPKVTETYNLMFSVRYLNQDSGMASAKLIGNAQIAALRSTKRPKRAKLTSGQITAICRGFGLFK